MNEVATPATMPATARRVPFVLGGRRIESTSGANVVVQTPSGEVCFPAFEESALLEIDCFERQMLADVPLQEILSFLNRVGKHWKSEEYSRRRIYIRQLQELLGYSPQAAAAEADRIGILLTAHARMYDIVAAELGSRFILDEWIAREEAWVRAFPRGLSVHVLPGNVPLSGVISMVRALVTKNVCIAKLSRRRSSAPGHPCNERRLLAP
jgi:long-chain-fatty-acyl-CoA reductase